MMVMMMMMLIMMMFIMILMMLMMLFDVDGYDKKEDEAYVCSPHQPSKHDH